MSTTYTYNGPIDCTQEPNVDNIKGKTVIITGGMVLQYEFKQSQTELSTINRFQWHRRGSHEDTRPSRVCNYGRRIGKKRSGHR